MDWKLTADFLPQARRANVILPQMRCCFGQPICCCQAIENFFIILILFILPPE